MLTKSDDNKIANINLDIGRVARIPLVYPAATNFRSTVFSRWCQRVLPSNTRFFGSTPWPPKMAARSVQPFLHSWCRILFTRYIVPHYFLRGRYGPPSNTWFFQHIRDPAPQKASRSSQLFFHNIRSLPTDRPTDGPTERRRNSTCKNMCDAA